MSWCIACEQTLKRRVVNKIFHQLSRPQTRWCVVASTLCVQYLTCCHLANSSEACSRPLIHIHGDTQCCAGHISNRDAIASQATLLYLHGFYTHLFYPLCLSCICPLTQMLPPPPPLYPLQPPPPPPLSPLSSPTPMPIKVQYHPHTYYLSVCMCVDVLAHRFESLHLSPSSLYGGMAAISACIFFLTWVKVIILLCLFFYVWQFDRFKMLANILTSKKQKMTTRSIWKRNCQTADQVSNNTINSVRHNDPQVIFP